MSSELKVVGALAGSPTGEYLVDDADDQGTGEQAQAHADDARNQRVGSAFEHEHLDQVPPLGADGAGHAEFRPAGGGQHDEDQEYQQYPDHDGEEAEQDEEAGNDTADLLRGIQEAALYVDDDELGHGDNEGVDLSGQSNVSGGCDSFEELGANSIVREERDQFIGQLGPCQFLMQLSQVVLQVVRDARPLAALRQLIQDVGAGEGGLQLGRHLAIGEQHAEGAGDLVAEFGAAILVAAVGDDDGVDLILAAEHLLGPCEVQEQRRLGTHGATAGDDALHGQGCGLAVHVDRKHVAGDGLEVPCGGGVDEDLVRAEVLDPYVAAILETEAAKALEGVGVDTGDLHSSFAARGALVDGGSNFRQAGGEAVDGVDAGKFLLEGSEALHGEVGGAAELVVLAGAGGQDERIDGAEAIDDSLADGESEGISRTERGGHDQGGDHDADDDQGGLGLAARDVAEGHLEHDPVPQGHDADDGERGQEESQEDDHDVVHPDAKEVFHQAGPPLGAWKWWLVLGEAIADD